MGYVNQDEETQKYYMTLKIANISEKVLQQVDILSICPPYLNRLAEYAGETVHLVKRTGTNICYIYKLEPPHTGNSIQIASYIGMLSPLYSTGVGKAIMAQLSDSEVSEILETSRFVAKTQYTIRNKEQLFHELKQIKAQGYSLDNQENEWGIRCIAACIPDSRKSANYALSISAPISRMSDKRIQELVPIIKETAHELSQKICPLKRAH